MSLIRRLLNKALAEKELDKELLFHVDQQTADYVAAGMSTEEARRRARLRFGGIERVKEEVRDTRWETHLDNLLRDFRYAVLRQNSMRTENSAIPCRDGCPIQVIPSSSSAKNLSRRNARAVYLYI